MKGFVELDASCFITPQAIGLIEELMNQKGDAYCVVTTIWGKAHTVQMQRFQLEYKIDMARNEIRQIQGQTI